MTLPIVLRPEAEQDLMETRYWYDRQRHALGSEFAEEVFIVFDLLAEQPELFPFSWEDIRTCRLRRFPYLVHDRAFPDRVEVLAVMHGSRDPSSWQSRA